jgi:tripartite-type tricarboxylate transporter receptor subunit TctC
MTPARKHSFTRSSAMAIGMFLACALPAAAQGFPNKPLRIITPVPAGGGVDILSRAIGQRLAENLGVAVVVDNRPGASAVIGTELLAKSAPDGHTLMMGYSAHATNPLLYKLAYDTVKDFAAIIHVEIGRAHV